MPSPTAKTTAAPAPSPSQARRPAARTSKPSASSARVHIRTKIPKVPAKRKRPLMPKEQSKNKKNWARGAREDILYAHLPKYTEELAKGGKSAAEYAVKICHELNYKIPYDMPDWEDPDTIPEYDRENPPPLPKLSDEKEKERAAALQIRNKRVMNWLNYRARKVVSAIPKGSTDVNNAFALWMMRLTGTSGAPKKARQGWQQYQHENPDLVQESAQRAWDARQEGGGEGDSDDESEDEDTEEAEDGVSETKKQVKGVGFISKHARKLFDKLPLEERRALKARAKAEKEAEKELWDKAIKAPPSQHPKDVQAARDAIPSFLNPILDGINQVAGDAHVYVLVGGRDPSRGGAVTVQHYGIGTNKDNNFFRDWDPQRLNRNVLTFFGEYLSTVWDDEECARMALGTEPGEDGEEDCGTWGGDVFEDARYRFDETGKHGEDGVSGEGGEEGEGGENGEGGEDAGRWNEGEDAGNGGEGGEDGNGEVGGGEDGGGEDGGGEDVGYHGEGDGGGDDVDPRPSKRRRVRKDISPVVEDGAPQATSSANNTDGQPLSRPPRPKPRPTRRSTRNTKATAGHSTSPELATASPSAGDLDGLVIDPILLAPPYVQIERPQSNAPSAGACNTFADEAMAAPSASSPCPPPTAAAPSTDIDDVAAPLAAASRPAVLAPSTRSTRAHLGGETAAAFPNTPDGAEAWFVSALGMLRVELGEEWTRLLQSWARYEICHDYGKNLPTRNSRLDGAKSRPKEVSAWIGGGRWRSPGCEPAKKNGKFASTLMQSWWAWYVKLAPEWREEDEDGRLEDFAEFGEGTGKLDIPGVNGVLSLVVCLKWVGEALASGTDIHDRVGVDRSWRRATTDLTKMLEGFGSS